MKLLRFLTLLSLSLIIAACGGGGGGDSGSSGYGPTASAGVSRSVAMGDTVTLDGSASKAGSSGGALTYAWTLVSKPASSNAGLSSASGVNPSFVADVPGAYVVRLVVNDGSLGSEAVTVTITATNPEPVAIAETEQNVLIGSTVVLDGSGSVPPTGGSAASLRYQWTLTGVPTGSSAALSNPTAAQASFYADLAGTYTATLVVTYESKVSNVLQVTVTAKASNSVPTAVAKVKSVGGSAASPTNAAAPYSYTVERGQAITLDASDSVDGDGDGLSYRWYFFYPGNVASLIPACSKLPRDTVLTGANPTFTPDAAGNWTVYMVAFDGTSVSSTTNINLKVTKPAGAANTAPEARFVSQGESLERELGSVFYAFGTSCDIDGDTLTRSYEWGSTPAGFTQTDLTGVTGLAVNLSVPGDYTVKLTVKDGQGGSSTVEGTINARTGANVRPVPAVTADAETLMIGSTAWFDGSSSSDKNGDKLSYAWTLIDRPDGSTATLQNASSARASVVADVAGAYIARLQVTDPLGATGQTTTVYHARVLAKAKNNAPTVESVMGMYNGVFIGHWTMPSNTVNNNLGSDEQPFIAGNELTFSANSVLDPDNDALYYLWTLAQPAGSSLVDADTARWLARTPLIAGSYTATFVTSDGVASSSPRSVPFKVVQEADYPTVLLKAHGSSINASGQPNFSTPVALPYALTDQTYSNAMYYTLFAYGGDYTIVDLKTTSATNGVAAPTFSGLVEGQVIRKGQSALFSIVPPTGLSTLQTRDVTWTFGIKEKPGYTFTYRMKNRD